MDFVFLYFFITDILKLLNRNLIFYSKFQNHIIILDMSLIRKPAPQFNADAWFNGDFCTINIKDFIGKYVVLFFYPLDFTFVCPT